MPFKPKDYDRANWPILDPRRDSGKYIVGIFEGGVSANGVHVHAVSAWMSPTECLALMSEAASKEIKLQPVDPEALTASLPKEIGSEITETMLLVDGYSYYGDDAEEQQAEHDKWLGSDQQLTRPKDIIRGLAPWTFE